MNLSHTHTTGITLHKHDAVQVLAKGPEGRYLKPRRVSYWRHHDSNDGRNVPVGPEYPTLAEALKDTARYVRDSWNYTEH